MTSLTSLVLAGVEILFFDEFISANRSRHQTLYLPYYLKTQFTQNIVSWV